MINIGPWWIYDTIILVIIVSCMIIGFMRGFWAALYFLVGELIVVVIIYFLAKVVTNAIDDLLINKINSLWNVESFFSFVKTILNSLFSVISFGDAGVKKPEFTDSGGISSLVNFIFAEIIFVIVYFIFFVIFNIILIILYFKVFKNMFRKIKLNAYVQTTIGVLFGFFNGLCYAYPIYLFVSFPLFTTTGLTVNSSTALNPNIELTSDEQLSIYYLQTKNYQKALSYFEKSLDYSEPTPVEEARLNVDWNDFVDRIENGSNNYDDYSISGHIYDGLFIGRNLVYKGIEKYIINPVKTIVDNGKESDFNISSLTNKLDNIQDIIVKGYASSDLKDFPISYWLELLPVSSRAFVRMFTEMLLSLCAVTTGHVVYDQASNQKSGYGNVEDLINEITMFETETKRTSKALDLNGFKDFYSWAQAKQTTTNSYNEFNVAANKIKEDGGGNRYIFQVCNDPTLMYNFLKNIFITNYKYATNGTFQFMPNVYTSLYLIKGMEIVPSGEYMKLIFGARYESDNTGTGTDTVTAKHYFVIKDYFDFINENYNK